MNLSVIGVSQKKEAQFKSKGINTIQDLIRYLPIRYQDFTKETGILDENEVSCLIVKVKDVSLYTRRTKYIIAKCTIVETGETLSVWWFNQPYLLDRIRVFIGLTAIVAGKVKFNETYASYSIVSPQIFDTVIKGRKIYPVYRKIPGMGNDYLREKIKAAFDIPAVIHETIPYALVKQERLLPMQDALYGLHFPVSMEQLSRAQERLIFDELLYFAVQNEKVARNSSVGSPYQIKTNAFISKVKAALPYSLTRDQSESLESMLKLVKEGKRLNALIQGDVGCGKTILAFLLMIGFAKSGFQVLLMAPTQVLARQHYQDLKALVEPLGGGVVYLGSDCKVVEIRSAKEKIASGEAQFVIGTSSLLGKDISYKKLALVVVDEEHRFGVTQRDELISRAAEGVHVITMSATPIPRSLAMVLYGNTVQLYTIHSMPAGRLPVQTGIQNDRNRIYRFLNAVVNKFHHQAYVVCPIVEASDSEVMDGVKSVEEVSQEYKTELEPLGIRIGTLTGRDRKGKIEETIQAFQRGEIDILISTSVIEVGVNIPNATAMIITNAERFGLSSLHQLRGRVGRSVYQSYCVLESSDETEKSRKRLETMCQTTDGFKIAEADLRIRGSGDLLGTKQSGENWYMSLVLAYPERYRKIQEIAKKIIDEGIICPLLE